MKFKNLLSLKYVLNNVKLAFKMSQNDTQIFKKVYVRNVENEDRIQISFKYSNPSYGIQEDKLFNFSRLKSEELEKSLARMSTNVSKEVNKKLSKKLKKSKKTDEIKDCSIAECAQNITSDIPGEENLLAISVLSKDEVVFEGSTFNDEAWRHGGCMKIGDQKYDIEFNSPTVKLMSLPQVIMSGYVIMPKVTLEFASKKDSKFKWFVEKQTVEDKNESSNAKKFKVTQSKSGDKVKPQDWLLVSEEFTFTPGDEHKNCFTKLSCVPQDGARAGEEASFISKCRVVDGPKNCPFEKRHEFTKAFCGDDSFRIVCYNILADLYADSDYSREHLFPYCPPHFLTIDYRKQLIIKELMGYKADVMCLQEVDRKVFEADLRPIFNAHGFDALLRVKTGEVPEGCATFYRRSKFKHIQSYDIALNDFLSSAEELKEVWGVLEGNELMRNKMTDRNSVLQVSLLQTTTPPLFHLLVATVHLYFHHRASHIRLIQTHIGITHLRKVLQQLKQEENIHAHLIYCGDFNAYAGSGVHEYLTGNLIPSSHADWFTGGRAEYLPNLKLSHDLDLVNLTGSPAYTNYVGGFNACLDYIYASNSLRPIRTIPLPSHADVTKHTALPNEFFPSDHLAIGCEVAWPTIQSEETRSN